MKRKITALFLLLLLFLPAKVYAMGEHINYDNSDKSNILVIGDSRVWDLGVRVNAYKKKTKYSFNATRGAHYISKPEWLTGEWADKNLVISSPKYLKEQKALVKKILKKHGSCIVILEATINDVNEFDASYEKASLKKMLELRKQLLAIEVNYKGKMKSPHFRVTSVIPPIDNDSRVVRFNKTLKDKFGGHYIELGLNKVWKPYYKDRLHLNKAGCDLFYTKLSNHIKGK